MREGSSAGNVLTYTVNGGPGSSTSLEEPPVFIGLDAEWAAEPVWS